eukprot:1781375-Amphidinium_carterae.1
MSISIIVLVPDIDGFGIQHVILSSGTVLRSEDGMTLPYLVACGGVSFFQYMLMACHQNSHHLPAFCESNSPKNFREDPTRQESD